MNFELDTAAQLVAQAARAESRRPEEIANLLRSEFDWARVLGLAERNYVIPLLYEALADAAPELTPTAIFEQLAMQRKHLRFRARVFCDELSRLASLFAGAGISVIHYKGPVSSDMLYGDVYRRTSFDLDFLVRKSELGAVCRLLQEQGYSCNVNLPEMQRIQFEREQKEYAFTSGLVCVEPHWSITANRYNLDLDYEALWDRAVVHNFEGTELLTFSPPDTLILTSVVGAKGKWKRLQMVSDIAQLYKQLDPLDAEEALALAKELGCERMLLVGSRLAAGLLAAPLPEPIIRRCRADARAVDRLAKQIVQQLFAAHPRAGLLGASPSIFSPLLYAMRERRRDRLRYLVQTTTTPLPMHMDRIPLPGWAHPLYRVAVPLHDYLLAPSMRLARSMRRNTG